MCTSVTFEYSTSLEKWRGIREFAVANFLEVKYIDAMIAKIEEVGDVNLKDACDPDLEVKDSYTHTIGDLVDYFDSVYSDDEFPCPHCAKYVECSQCPLHRKDGGHDDCCEEWVDAKDEARRLMRGVGLMRGQ